MNDSMDAGSLKALTHPLRVRLLGLLRHYGPSTATELGRRTGESSGSTSYHLRQLARHGFVVDDRCDRSRRKRVWKACQAVTSYDEEALSRSPKDAETAAMFLRTLAAGHARRSLAWVDSFARAREPWRGAGTISDWGLSLSRSELESLKDELWAVVSRYRVHDPERPSAEGRRFVALQVQLLPETPS